MGLSNSQPYEQIYLHRRGYLSIEDVQENPVYNYAALLEYWVGTKVLPLKDARRQLVDKYPQLNVLCPTVTRVDRAGRKTIRERPTILELIQDVPGCVYNPRSISEYERAIASFK